jgi:UDP-N-acetylglucosamine 2-epimerase (non-hydrolysing)
VKVVSVVGARPQFVKAFPTSQALADHHEEVLVHTGQHYDEALSEVFFEELAIPTPDHQLAVGSGSHARQTAEMLSGVDAVVDSVDPDAVVVYGDTNSTLAGALSAAKRDATLVHVEAGLRSFDRAMPEEVNRVLTDHVSDVLCAPSAVAVENLAAEGLEDGVARTGDVMYDALLSVRDRALDRSTVLDEFGLRSGEFVLATVHRAGNADDPDRLAAILDGLATADDPVVFPAHPRTLDRLREFDLHEAAGERLRLVEPVGYLDFLRLVDEARVVATDSGGVQKEAFYLDTPCVTLRDRTEWAETVDAGGNVLVGADADRIDRARPPPPPARRDRAPYGDGHAARRIVDALEGST